MGNTRNDRRARRAVPAVVVIALAGASLLWPHGAAHAAITTFDMSPTSGPPGTTVSISGSGCSPGLVLNSADRITIAATTVPPVTAQLTVNSSGAWSGSFTIPSNASAASALVNVVCLTDGLPSLLTIYTSQTFTVTQASATTTTVPAPTPTTSSTGTTPPGGADTTTPRPSDRNDPDSSDPNDPSSPGSGGSDGGAAPGTDDGGDGSDASERDGNGGARGKGDGDSTAGNRKSARTTARAAALGSPELTAMRHDRGGGMAWVAWLIVALLVLGGGTGAYLWHRTRPARLAPTDAETNAT